MEGSGKHTLANLKTDVIYSILFLIISLYYAKVRFAFNIIPPDLDVLDPLSAYKYHPFQTGILMPWVVKLIEWAGLPGAPPLWIAEVFSAFLLLLSFRYLLYLFVGNVTLSYILSFVMLYALPFNFIYPDPRLPITYPNYLPALMRFKDYYQPFHLHDTPSLALMTLGLVFLVRKKNIPYYVVFTLSVLNYELAVVLALVRLFIEYGEVTLRRLLAHAAISLAIFISVQAALMTFYPAGTGADLYYFRLTQNIALLTDPSMLPAVLGSIGYLWIPAILFFHRIGSRFVRRSLAAIIPLALFILCFGDAGAMGQHGIITPLVVLGFCNVVVASLSGNSHGTRSSPSIERRRRVVELAVFAAVSLLAAFYFMKLRLSLNGIYERAQLYDLLAGTADRPFQARALVFWVVSLLSKLDMTLWFVKADVDWFKLTEFLSVSALVVAFSRMAFIATDKAIYSRLIVFLIFLLLPYNYLFPRSDLPAVSMSTVPTLMHYPTMPLYYAYDMPSLMFFTLGLLCLYRRSYVPYYLIFTVATFNRETACFLTVIHLLVSFGQGKKMNLLLHLAAQVSIWVSIKVFLSWYYAKTGGGFVEPKLYSNYDIMSNPTNYFYLMSSFGFLWIPVVLHHRLIGDPFVRRSLLVVIPFALGMLFVGNYDELRIFGELTILVALGLALIVKTLVTTQGAPTPGEPTNPD